jgi:hypothetical protein
METKDDIEYSRAYLSSNKYIADQIRRETLKSQTELAYKRMEKAVAENKGRVTIGQFKPYLEDVTHYSRLVSSSIAYKLLEMELFYRQRLITAVTMACEFIEHGLKTSLGR